MYLKVNFVWVKYGLGLGKEFHKCNFRVLSGFLEEGGTKKPTHIVLGISPTYFTLNTRILSQNICFFYPRLHRFPKQNKA